MTHSAYQPPLSFEQILTLVKQLPDSEKLRLSKELEKDTRERRLTQLLEAFQTDELPLETITEEVEAVRAEMYEERHTTLEPAQAPSLLAVIATLTGIEEAFIDTEDDLLPPDNISI